MSRRLAILVGTLAFASAVLLVIACLLFPFSSTISPTRSGSDSWWGVVFWVAIALIAGALPVQLPAGPPGRTVDLSFAPIVAVMVIGGPAVSALVALAGTIQLRELRGRVPWYGVIANHSAILAPAVLSALVVYAFPGRHRPEADLVATVLGGVSYSSLNILSSAGFVHLRTGAPIWRVIRIDAGAYVAMLALAPLAWLMAQMYVSAGWWTVLLFAVPLYTTRVAYQRFFEIRQMFTQTVRSLAEAVDKRDKFTSGHSHRVQEIAVDIGRVLKLSDAELEALEWGGLLHDIGKIGVPDAVLLKQERLTRAERAIMNSHPVLGAEIIAPVERLAPELPIIRHHHEWFNGSGYPDRLVADEIPKLARILHVADAFEAMTAVRPYRMTPLTPQQALGELRKFGGIQFDPEVVDAFVQTRWVADVPDPGRPQPRDIPLLGQTTGIPATPLLAVTNAAPTSG